MNISNLQKQLIDLDLKHFPFPWSEKNWHSHFDDETKKTSKILKEGSLIGFCCWEYLSLEKLCHIHKVLIIPDFRGLKMGTGLIQTSLDEMKKNYPEAACCFLEFESTNDTARNLYLKFGFEVLELVPNFYGSQRDGVRMLMKFST